MTGTVELIELAEPGGLWDFEWNGRTRTGTLVAIKQQPAIAGGGLFCQFTIDGEDGLYGCRMSAVIGPAQKGTNT